MEEWRRKKGTEGVRRRGVGILFYFLFFGRSSSWAFLFFFHRKYEHGGPVRKRLRFSSTHWPLRSNDVNSIQWRT